jgi:hypothetical protein
MLTFKTITATSKNIQYRLVFFNDVEYGELVQSSYDKKYHFKATSKIIKFKKMFLESFSNKEIKELIFDNFISLN